MDEHIHFRYTPLKASSSLAAVQVAENLAGAATALICYGWGKIGRYLAGSLIWVSVLLVTKPLLDLTWRWEFFSIFEQRVNPQAIIALLVGFLNILVLVFRLDWPQHTRRVLLLLAVALLSVVITPTSWGVNELLRLVSGVSFYFVAGCALSKKEQFDHFSTAFLICLSVPLILSLFQAAGLLPFEYWDWVDDHNVGRASGTYQHPSEIVFFLVFAVPLALYRWDSRRLFRSERVVLLGFFALAAAGLILTLHRTGWIVILIQVSIWYGMKRRWKQLLALGLAVLVTATLFSGWIGFLYQDFANAAKGEIDYGSGNFLRGRGANYIVFLVSYVNGTPIQWIFGKGGSIADVSQNLGIIDFAENEPHNDYIRVLHAYGLVGIFLYLSILAVFFRTSLRLKEFGNQFERGVGNVLLLTLIGFTVLSVTLEPLRYPTGCWYLFALGSIVVTLWSRRSSQRVLQVEAVT